jgi:hypothetical protein
MAIQIVIRADSAQAFVFLDEGRWLVANDLAAHENSVTVVEKHRNCRSQLKKAELICHNMPALWCDSFCAPSGADFVSYALLPQESRNLPPRIKCWKPLPDLLFSCCSHLDKASSAAIVHNTAATPK